MKATMRVVIISIFLCVTTLPAQILFEENFDYPAGDTLHNHSWTRIRSGGSALVDSTGLSYPNYRLSGIGNAARIFSTGGEEISRTFPEQNSDSLYIAFLVKIIHVSDNYQLFFYLGPPNASIFNRYLSFNVRKNASDSISFAVEKLGSLDRTEYQYPMNVTHLVVAKYKFNPNTTADDTVWMWVNPPFSITEPPYQCRNYNGPDAPGLANIVISMIQSGNAPPDAIIDGIVVFRKWQDIFPAVIHFNDANLEQAVRAELNKPSADITDVDMAALTSLQANAMGISDLFGMEHALNLTALDLSQNKINDLSPLQNLTSLQSLMLNNNNISYIAPLMNLINLERLQLSNNRVRDISTLGDLTLLRELDLSDNYLDHMDLLFLYGLDSLSTLQLNDNPGLISGTALQALVDSLVDLHIDQVEWQGVIGVDPDSAVLCWVEPFDSTGIGQSVTALATATNSSGRQVRVRIDWGDGVVSDYSEFKDNGSTFEFTHFYDHDGRCDIRVMAEDKDAGETSWSQPWTLVVGHPVAAVNNVCGKINGFTLFQNYPNPFNPRTKIEYSLIQTAGVDVTIYNTQGRQVRQLLKGVQYIGNHMLIWDGRDDRGEVVAGGLYFYKIRIKQNNRYYSDIKKMILIK
jgi:hypothetical protein